jgi:magnesium chelatase accessory protein
MDWALDLPRWSHPGLSRRVVVGRVRWHVQETGRGNLILLLPGAGASTHTWRHLIPLLAKTHRVVAVDLPGQGFSQGPYTRMRLDLMAEDFAALAASEQWQITCAIGHSAGAAIALELAQRLSIPQIIGINPALAPFEGVAEWLFPLVARTLALNPFTASIFTLSATPQRAKQLIEGTGSQIDADGMRFYARLFKDRAHVNGALNMMAKWSLDDLNARLPEMTAKTLFLTGETDQAVPPEVAERAAAQMPNARVIRLGGLGHLAHEEAPQRLFDVIETELERDEVSLNRKSIHMG